MDTGDWIILLLFIAGLAYTVKIITREGRAVVARMRGEKPQNEKEKVEVQPSKDNNHNQKDSNAKAIVGIAVAGLIIWYFFGGGIDSQLNVFTIK